MTGDARDGFEAAREAILEAALAEAAFTGWTAAALTAAARETNIDEATVKAAFPRGIADVLDFWSGEADAAMVAAIAEKNLTEMRFRERVAFAVRTRIETLERHKEAARRAAATLALPHYAGLGARLAWRTADAIWRALGDTSFDFNFYTKRGILVGVYLSTMARWLADDEAGAEATWGFLDRRIENVMSFEKVKAQARDAGFDAAAPVRFFAKLRYRD